jgi:hypothetical protein
MLMGDPASLAPDPRYVAARRVLLRALEALAPHRDALVVAGAQAVYLRAGAATIGIAAYTTDGDLALDPTLLLDAPELEEIMRGAGFTLLEPQPERVEPGIWVAQEIVDGESLVIPVDLIVPEGFASGGGRRGARLGPHGNRAARRTVGLEASLVDNDVMTITSLEPSDTREIAVKVAGSTALLVAKAHKIHDRVEAGKADRIGDKDAADVYRLMQTTPTATVIEAARRLLEDQRAAEPTAQALQYTEALFGTPASAGVQMATRALRLAISEDEIAVLMTSYAATLRDGLAAA